VSVTKRILVTGGTGFIGAATVRRLVRDGHRVRVLDSDFRGQAGRLADIRNDVELVQADIRDAAAVDQAARGIDAVFHLAYINGTQNFYEMPELVLEVGVKGMINILDACIRHDVPELFAASSSEVYQTPATVPTDETVPLVVPDPLNPRYSYGGGKILTELMAINYGRKRFKRVVIFRPHNVYGPDMGWEHVLPQFVVRMKALCTEQPGPVVRFPIQGTGGETRAFIFIDDFVAGLACLLDRGAHLGIYHIGTQEEVSIADVAGLVGTFFGRQVELEPGALQAGGTPRRCPDIAKLRALGFKPRVALRDGLPILARWYADNAPPTRHSSETGR